MVHQFHLKWIKKPDHNSYNITGNRVSGERMANGKSDGIGKIAAWRAADFGSVVSAGLTASLVGFAGSVALNLQAARAVGASPAQAASWIMALCVGIAVTSLYLSLRHRMPIPTAWSTPGAALIAASAIETGIGEAVGAFLLAAGLVVITAFVRPLGRLMEKLPKPLAAAMLAGILLGFCIDVVAAAAILPLLVLPLVAIYFVALVVAPGLSVPAVLVLGIGAAAMTGLVDPACCDFALSAPVLIAPRLEISSVVGLALPLYIVTMASQNLAGLAVLKADGYEPSPSSCLASTGLASLALAPFGGQGVCLAAITTAICSGPSCHADPARRWGAGIVVGICYILFALFAMPAITLLEALPKALIMTVVGLALLAPFMASLKTAIASDPGEQRAAIVTLVVAASGVTFFGISAALWGLVAGLLIVWLPVSPARARGPGQARKS